MNSKNYIIITPVLNEEKHITRTIVSVITQTQLPQVWVIIDGGSKDGSQQTIETLCKNYWWAHLIQQNDKLYSDDPGHINVSLAVIEAYGWAVKYCRENAIVFDYIWTFDADQTFDSEVCEGIIEQCEKDPSIGAASGQAYNMDKHGNLIPDVYPEGELPNKRVYRKSAIDQIGGFPDTKYSYDTVILAKLRLKNWKIKSFPEYKIINLREDSGIERDSWKSAVQFGRARFYLGYSPMLLVFGCGFLVGQRKIKKAVGIFCGYAVDWVFGAETIRDKQIWEHFHNERLDQILKKVLHR